MTVLAESYYKGSWSDRKHASNLFSIATDYSRIKSYMGKAIYHQELYKGLLDNLVMSSDLCKVIFDYCK